MKLSLAFSPCPNDTFIFDAWVNGRLQLPLQVETCLEDVETLNRQALLKTYDITKLSFAVYPEVMTHYQLLTSGSALGRGVGPLLVSRKKIHDVAEIRSVAIPGMHTTACLLFRLLYPGPFEIQEMVFHEIEHAVANGLVDAGVIIHESRFTFEAKGLHQVADLGERWEALTGQPLPLGGIALRRDLPEELKRSVNHAVRQSVSHALRHPDASASYVRQYAQEMSPEVIRKHIDLYVNEFTIDLGESGKRAISRLLFENRPVKDDMFVE
jgi:1,4-dihydroxy-6-naphthoate synthase